MITFSSDSESDLEMLALLSDWDSDSDLEMFAELLNWGSDSNRSPHCINNSHSINNSRRINNDIERPRRYRRIKRRINYTQTLNDAEFAFRFRLNKQAVQSLCAEIMPYIRVTSKRNNGVSPLHQLLLTLRFYALGTILTSVADFVGVSKATASRIVADISTAIAKLYNKYVTMHSGSSVKFYKIAQFPRVYGVIDCFHVKIQSAGAAIGEEFRNTKGYFSLNVQAVCDADLNLMNVVARWPGSLNDATIFNKSDLKAQCEDGALGNLWLLGDSDYEYKNYLLTPLLNPVTKPQHRYNEAHILTRNTIERTFGVWKRRFPVISLAMRLSLRNIQAVIIATSVLHNICRKFNIEDVPPEVQVATPSTNRDYILDEAIEPTVVSDIRQKLINNFFTL